MQHKHLWQGEWISDGQLQTNMDNISEFTTAILGNQFPLEYFFECVQNMRSLLLEKGKLYEKFVNLAMKTQQVERLKAEGMLSSITGFISKENLERKLKSELGSINPFAMERPSLKEEHFESWAPMGVLVHIAPTNVFTVGILCVMEGLLSGNINLLKTSSNQNQLPQLFFSELLKFDTKDILKDYVIILEVSSKKQELMQQIIDNADVVSAWGSEEAIKSVQNMTPQGVRFVPWGHKISFAYFTKENLNDIKSMEEVCRDICLLDQNACSSPQDVFIECETFEEMKEFSESFAKVLEKVSKQMPRTIPEESQQAEISTVVSIAKTEEAMGLTHVVQSNDFTWNVIADFRGGLGVSPLFRTILIKPLLEKDIVGTLHPMKSYLQTAALIAPKERIIKLSQLLFGAGCLRIREAGHMHDGYVGEPHDGVYALPSFMKRTSLNLAEQLREVSTFEQFKETYVQELGDTPIMDKTKFQSMSVDSDCMDLTFKSGGSSGKTTYSYFTYEDYHAQMKAVAQGLYSTGLDPKEDRVINMFAAGHLYGGFLSFHDILEHMEIAQYPMGITEDVEVVGRLIVEKRINTVFTAPALIMKLFEANSELFKKERVLKKLFFGGDHFAQEQRDYLKEEYGVEVIKAAAYGSNDAGVLGYQCPHCLNNEYHLLSQVQTLEVFDVEDERKVSNGEEGRLVFSSKQRKGQNIVRYDLGDLGYVHKEACECGRLDPKFSLLGRSSDVFKAGGPFLKYGEFVKHLENGFSYGGLVQLVLGSEDVTEQLTIRVERSLENGENEIVEYLVNHYEEVSVSAKELGVEFVIEKLPLEEFESVVHSGKIRHFIDKRSL